MLRISEDLRCSWLLALVLRAPGVSCHSDLRAKVSFQKSRIEHGNIHVNRGLGVRVWGLGL